MTCLVLYLIPFYFIKITFISIQLQIFHSQPLSIFRSLTVPIFLVFPFLCALHNMTILGHFYGISVIVWCWVGARSTHKSNCNQASESLTFNQTSLALISFLHSFYQAAISNLTFPLFLIDSWHEREEWGLVLPVLARWREMHIRTADH